MITSKSIGTGGLGRFGNQAFTIASTIGIATKNGQPYSFPRWRTVDNALFGDPVDDIQSLLVNKLPEMDESLSFKDIPYHWSYIDYKVPIGNWNICSHLQDPRYFEHCMPLIRETFRFKDEPPLNDYVAIHYRAGDYIDDPNAYHPRCGIEYYKEAMKQFPTGSKFVVFTDDLNRAEDVFYDYMIDGDPILGISERRNYIQDFKFMKRCRHFITANSSFSLFAAILGEHPDKKIICPHRWFGTSANGLTFEGYPKGAIII